jgi:hypothetical protein
MTEMTEMTELRRVGPAPASTRWLRRLGVAAVSLPLFALAMWLWSWEPHILAHDSQPLRTSGRIGHVVTNPSFAFRVDGIAVAHSISTGSFSTDRRQTADGVFLIVKFRAMGEKKPYNMDDPRLESGPDTFRTSGRIGLDSEPASSTYEPLMWRSGQVCFEIPKNRLAGARLVVGEGGLLTQLSAETAIDLGIGRTKAADLLAHAAEGYNLGGPGL